MVATQLTKCKIEYFKNVQSQKFNNVNWNVKHFLDMTAFDQTKLLYFKNTYFVLTRSCIV